MKFSLAPAPVENSLVLRLLWIVLMLDCLWLISQVDGGQEAVSVGGVSLPVTVILLWLSFAGCFLSYQYRMAKNIILELLGTAVSIVFCVGSLIKLQSGLAHDQLDLVTPILYFIAGQMAAHGYDLKRRRDFNFSLAVSVLIVAMVASSTSGLQFDFALSAYVAIAVAMLSYDCGADQDQGRRKRSFLHSFMVPLRSFVAVLGLLCLASSVFFMAVPSAQPLAMRLSEKFGELVNDTRSKRHLAPLKVRTPFVQFATESTGKLGAGPGEMLSSQIPFSQGPKFPFGADTNQDGKNTGQDKSSQSEQSGDSHSKQGVKQGSKQDDGKSPSELKQKPGKAETAKKEGGSGSSAKGGRAGQKNGSAAAKPGKLEGKPEESSKNKKMDLKNSPSAEDELEEELDDDSELARARDAADAQNGGTFDTGVKGSSSDLVAFTVRCENPMFYRQRCYDLYNGRHWVSSGIKKKFLGFEYEPGKGSLNGEKVYALPDGVRRFTVVQDFQLQSALGQELPAGGVPVELGLPRADFCIDEDGVLLASHPTYSGLTYSVAAVVPVYDLEKMRQSQTTNKAFQSKLRREMSRFLQVPEHVQAELEDYAKSVVGPTNSWFAKAEKLGNFLKKNFKYERKVKIKKGSTDMVTGFLNATKCGDCKQFSSAHVMLCRSLGIPARLVTGFAWGDQTSKRGVWVVKMRHAHAWSEVFVPGAGWVPFDPTPPAPPPSPEEIRHKVAKAAKAAKSPQAENGQRTAAGDTKREKGAPGSGQSVSDGGAKTKNIPDFFADVLAFFDGLKKQVGEVFYRSWLSFAPFAFSIFIMILIATAFYLARLVAAEWQDSRAMHPASRAYRRILRQLKILKVPVKTSDTARDVAAKIASFRFRDDDKKSALCRLFNDFINEYEKVYYGQRPELKEMQRLSTSLEAAISKMN